MLPEDSETTAQKSAAAFDDPRVQHFYDPAKSAGQAIAGSVGWNGHIAWDIYLFYKAGPKWEAAPPRPTHWMHQLKDSWADRRYFRTGGDLTAELFMTVNMLLQ